MSLNDPISCARIKTPARSTQCAHFSCFDLGAWLEFGASHHVFRCQICDKELNPQEVKVCRRFQEILRSTPPDAKSCKLSADFVITSAAGTGSAALRMPAAEDSLIQVAEGGEARVLIRDKKAAEEAGVDVGGGELEGRGGVCAGLLEDQLLATNLWDYNEEAEDLVEGDHVLATAAPEAAEEEEEEEWSGEDAAPVVARRMRRVESDSVEPSESSEPSHASDDAEMELTDDEDAMTDEEDDSVEMSGSDSEGWRGSSNARNAQEKGSRSDRQPSAGRAGSSCVARNKQALAGGDAGGKSKGTSKGKGKSRSKSTGSRSKEARGLGDAALGRRAAHPVRASRAKPVDRYGCLYVDSGGSEEEGGREEEKEEKEEKRDGSDDSDDLPLSARRQRASWPKALPAATDCKARAGGSAGASVGKGGRMTGCDLSESSVPAATSADASGGGERLSEQQVAERVVGTSIRKLPCLHQGSGEREREHSPPAPLCTCRHCAVSLYQEHHMELGHRRHLCADRSSSVSNRADEGAR